MKSLSSNILSILKESEDTRDTDELTKLVKEKISENGGNYPDTIEYKGKEYKCFNVMSPLADGDKSLVYYCNMDNTPGGDPQESNDYFFVNARLNLIPNGTGFKGVREINYVEDLTEDVSIDNDPDLTKDQVNNDVDYWTDIDETNTEDVSNAEPIGVYTISNTGAIYVYDIDYDINDRVLVGDSSDTTKARWVGINYDDLVDEDTGEPIPFFYWGSMKVPFNEVMRTNI